jgi:hypothetical protein
MPYPDFAATFAGSTESVPQAPLQLKDGTSKDRPPKEVPVSKLWLASPARKTVDTRTFKAGAGLMVHDPDGRRAINTWKPFDRSVEVSDDEMAQAMPIFLDHIEFLFPDANDRNRFLDWIAHIEQQPGVLPHTAWLHVSRSMGLGRNWLASVLTRVFSGSVAANFDLSGMLRTGFNGRLSRKVLAIVDEINEGGGTAQWEHAERMKSLITEDTRLINPKFARQSLEHNACRLLMFSNHRSAIPLEEGDRRIEVVVVDREPKPAEYYSKLYAALKDPKFIAAVAKFLGARDISRFNPGAWAVNTAGKQAVTQATRSPNGRTVQVARGALAERSNHCWRAFRGPDGHLARHADGGAPAHA